MKASDLPVYVKLYDSVRQSLFMLRPAGVLFRALSAKEQQAVETNTRIFSQKIGVGGFPDLTQLTRYSETMKFKVGAAIWKTHHQLGISAEAIAVSCETTVKKIEREIQAHDDYLLVQSSLVETPEARNNLAALAYAIAFN